MTTYSLFELNNRMQGRSITLEWDALVFMNKTKVNALLEQQYINNLNSASFLKRISGQVDMTPDGEEYLEMGDLILTHPRLSFEKADMSDSRVTATMDIVSGTVSYGIKGGTHVRPTILYSYSVGVHQGATLTMDINLAASKGTVNQQGKVVVDIGEGFNCRCNLVNNDKSQEDLGNYFKALFLQQAPEHRMYTLGMLDLRDIDVLAPEEFIIRTMATEDGKNRNSDDHGEGAVVLLVRTKGNNKVGKEPTEDSLDYLIPNDRDPNGKALYSGALVVASRAMFDWYMEKDLREKIGNNLYFEWEQSNVVARQLHAVTGGMELPSVYLEYQSNMNEYWLTNIGPRRLEFKVASPGQALKVASSRDGDYLLEWGGRQVHNMNLRMYNPINIPPTVNKPFNLYPSPSVVLRLTPSVDPATNKVSIKFNAESVECPLDFTEYDDVGGALPYIWREGFEEQVVAPLKKAFDVFADLELTEVSVLAISNLLFPEQHVLHLTTARFPGDLLLVGHIDPKETTFTLDPLLPMMQAGTKLKFTIRQLGFKADNVKWSVRGLDGTPSTVGSIVDGEYTAPDAPSLQSTAVRNVVTASYIDPDTGLEVTASAMVTVALSGVVVTPGINLIDMSDRKEVKFTASTLGEGPLVWTPLSGPGTLVPDGALATYTPPQADLPDGALQVAQFQVEDTSSGEKTIATVLLRQGYFGLNVEPAIHPGLRPKGTTLLRAPGTPEMQKWEIVYGGGSIDPATGIYTAPSSLSSPYAVVKVTLEEVVDDIIGYSVIHLSEHARQSEWTSLDVFDFEVDPSGYKVYANGLQQAKVTVRVKPSGSTIDLSPSEYESICLVSADQKHPLPLVGKAGVAEGEKWHYTLDEDKRYDKFPSAGALDSEGHAVAPRDVKPKTFYVQCHSVEDLRISARLRSDNGEYFYSNPRPSDGEADGKVIRLTAVKPPVGGVVGQVAFTFDEGQGAKVPTRVEGQADDEDLSTLDYWYLKLVIQGVQTQIRGIEFVGNSSMVRWESNSSLEDVHSITGYAKHGDIDGEGRTRLHFDPVLYRRVPGVRPAPTVHPSQPTRAGQVLFSLERREYWNFDPVAKRQFDTSLKAIVYDAYGNRHPVGIGFDGNDRNNLKIQA